ncbi:MAG: hypothetical protein GX221_06830 [Candidatus Riflebacteria bacterium]|nr:hypothetical protein [Candidatus Riflebacteria bacterium]
MKFKVSLRRADTTNQGQKSGVEKAPCPVFAVIGFTFIRIKAASLKSD